MIRCFSPYPGECSAINEEDYHKMEVSCCDTPLVLPPRSKAADFAPSWLVEDLEGPADEGSGYLYQVQKGIGAFAEQGLVKTGDFLYARKKRYRVTAVTGGGQSYEYMGGMDTISLLPLPSFNSRKCPFKACPPVSVLGKVITLPKDSLRSFEPIQLLYTKPKRVSNYGVLKIEFSSLCFNTEGVCHRDSFIPEFDV